MIEHLDIIIMKIIVSISALLRFVPAMSCVSESVGKHSSGFAPATWYVCVCVCVRACVRVYVKASEGTAQGLCVCVCVCVIKSTGFAGAMLPGPNPQA